MMNISHHDDQKNIHVFVTSC